MQTNLIEIAKGIISIKALTCLVMMVIYQRKVLKYVFLLKNSAKLLSKLHKMSLQKLAQVNIDLSFIKNYKSHTNKILLVIRLSHQELHMDLLFFHLKIYRI